MLATTSFGLRFISGALVDKLRELQMTSPLITVDAAECFNYAAWQNAVPLLRSITLENPTSNEFSALSLEMTFSPEFARRKRWTVDRIGPGQTVSLRDVDIDIDVDYLDRLDEAVRGVMSFSLDSREQTLVETTHNLRVLARDEWGGMASMGELLPAFVTPNDPALASLMKSAAEVLGRHGHSTALDGYQSEDPNRSYMLAAALWSAIAAKSLTYANPPGSFEKVGQKTRRVTTVLADRLATCLDTTLLFASGLEAVGLNPVLVMNQGHCFAGVWLVEKTLKKLNENDCSELRKAIAAKELIVFETTLVTHRPPAGFDEAMSAAEAAITESREHKFVAAIDVARARMSQVRPLASHGERAADKKEQIDSGPLSLPAVPRYDRPAVIEDDPRLKTPAGRIDRWQRRLLDLSLRNRLLNFRPNKQTVPVLCPNVSRLEDLLADGSRIRLVSLRDENTIADRDPELHQQRTQEDLDLEFAREALERKEIACPVDTRDLAARLTTLFRKAKNDLAEGGSNTLYLAVGFLRWKQTATGEKTYRAPLLLVPVKLTRRSASSPYYLGHHEDDVRFNATLLQLLKKDFDCDLTSITSMETDLPTDDSGVDVPEVLDRMRRTVRDIPGFEVVEESAIASFSFAKFLMWKDLVECADQLERNRVVHHLVNEPDKAFSSDGLGPMPQPHEIDTRYDPVEIVHPLPADSSQLTAVMAASEGHDLVIVGPPGTGKSQTIANIIAQCLAVGKTVLFVAEKTAALDVVHRRLREHGLGDCCVELHSNKAQRRRFLGQLEASWTNRTRPNDQEWLEVSERLRVRRDELNTYVVAIHAKYPNGWTVYDAMGLCIRERDKMTPDLPWPRSVTHDRDRYQALKEAVDDLALAYEAMPLEADLQRVQSHEWSMAWETDFLTSCERLKESGESLSEVCEHLSTTFSLPLSTEITAAELSGLYRLAHELSQIELPPGELTLHEHFDELRAELTNRRDLLQRREQADNAMNLALENFTAALGVPTTDVFTEEKKRPLYWLAKELGQAKPPHATLVFHPGFDSLTGLLNSRRALLERRDEAWEAVKARGFIDALVNRIEIDQLEKAWAKASKSFWPISIFRTRGVKKQLKSYMAVEGMPDLEVDLPLLREHKNRLDTLAENLASLGLASDLQTMVEQDPTSLDPLLDSARRLREAIAAAGLTPDSVGDTTQNSLSPLVAAAGQLYPRDREIEDLRVRLRDNLAATGLPSELQAVVEKDACALESQLEAAHRVRKAARVLGFSHEVLAGTLESVQQHSEEERRKAATEFCRCAKGFQAEWQDYTSLASVTPVANESTAVVGDAVAQAERVLSNRTLLKQWTAWIAARKHADELGLDSFVDSIESGETLPSVAATRFELAYTRWWLPIAVDRSDTLRTFQKFRHEDAIENFRKLDELSLKAAAPRAQRAIFHGLPPSDQVPRRSELGLLRHQMGLKRPSKSIREIISGMPESFGKLAPCLLMSPLSIAQYLPTDQAQFDVVVFDEASQIPTWDAIGAIARGKQTIIVGDPKQLPPTNFFGKADSDEDNEELDDFEKDLESILDEVQASGLPTLQLNWHYRSRHESLITFSNYHYYGNNLVTFPAAESEDRGVSLVHVEGGLYDRGKSRTNRAEAEAIVADAVERMKRCLAKPENERLTYGVVTFNSQQQTLIEDLFDQALRDVPQLEWFFADDRFEPTAVKNLENVQGDERDVMYFSIGFAKDAAGRFPIDFGAINRNGGERRLNVAVTRSRQTLYVYASFLPDELRAERSSARGVHDLKAFLEFAHRGPEAIASRTEGSVGDFESPLEEAIAEALSQLGWQVEPQIGVSSFRVDIGVIHPDRPGAYLAGVECDGATYHRSAAARDRDKTRQQVLEDLGWNILRVWSPDWWYDSDSAIEDVHRQLTELLESSREEAAKTTASVGPPIDGETDTEPGDLTAEQWDEKIEPPIDFAANNQEQDSAESDLPQLVAKNVVYDVHKATYELTELADVSDKQDQFFDAGYTRELRRMALLVLKVEGPVRDDVIARRIARAHGFARTGARIKECVLSAIPEVTKSLEEAGSFLWRGGEAASTVPFRYPMEGDERRSLEEVPMEELIGLVQSRPDLASSEDPALSFAREIGLSRLAKSARERLEAAIECVAGAQTP